MKLTALSCVLLALTTSVGAAAAPRTDPAIRPGTESAPVLLEDTMARSSTARALAAALGATDVIVHVMLTHNPSIGRGATMLVTCSGKWRYVRIVINAWLFPWEQGPLLAHELWHALEIARAPAVRDSEGMRALYRSVLHGWGGDDRFDTDMAHRVQRAVEAELRQHPGHG